HSRRRGVLAARVVHIPAAQALDGGDVADLASVPLFRLEPRRLLFHALVVELWGHGVLLIMSLLSSAKSTSRGQRRPLIGARAREPRLVATEHGGLQILHGLLLDGGPAADTEDGTEYSRLCGLLAIRLAGQPFVDDREHPVERRTLAIVDRSGRRLAARPGGELAPEVLVDRLV